MGIIVHVNGVFCAAIIHIAEIQFINFIIIIKIYNYLGQQKAPTETGALIL